jgi:hypothetical protein
MTQTTDLSPIDAALGGLHQILFEREARLLGELLDGDRSRPSDEDRLEHAILVDMERITDDLIKVGTTTYQIVRDAAVAARIRDALGDRKLVSSQYGGHASGDEVGIGDAALLGLLTKMQDSLI